MVASWGLNGKESVTHQNCALHSQSGRIDEGKGAASIAQDQGFVVCCDSPSI